RPALQSIFIDLCRQPVADYLERFEFRSDLLKAMYAVTDGFSGLCGGYRTPGTGMNFLIHNMCRLPRSDGTWMILKGGMGVVSQRIADGARRHGARFVTGTRVTRIDTASGKVTGVVLDDGSEIAASTVVVGADPFRMRDLVGTHAFPA